jgi:hypothetical protein
MNMPLAREYDLARIRDEADFRRLVPLRQSTPLPLTAERLAIHRRAMRAALALAVHRCPRRTRLLTRPLVWLGEENVREAWLPRLLGQLAHTATAGEVGCVIGPASRVAAWVPHADACISWDDGTPADGIELLVRPEGSLAVREPGDERYRLLTDHGMYFEFLPAEEVALPQPRRLGIAEVRPGNVYELVVSTPGAFATRTGLGVVFDTPGPMIRRVALPAMALPPVLETLPTKRNANLPTLPSLGNLIIPERR